MPTIGRYEVLSTLGKGGMGTVYLAHDTLLGRQVAIKTIRLDDHADAQEAGFLRDRLIKEARAAAALQHSSIISVFDVVIDSLNNSTCLVMEYVNGSTLGDLIKLGALPTIDAQLKVLLCVAEALDYAHSKGVIHRDIKPANIMIDHGGTAKIADFGIAKLISANTSTTAGLTMGTLEFMAPEQIRGDAIDGRTDQFSLAAMTYGIVTGRKLFQADSFVTLAHKMLNEMPALPSTVKPGLSPAIDQVLLRGLAKEPQQRYPTCAAFIQDLQRAFHDAPPPIQQQHPPLVPPPPPPNQFGTGLRPPQFPTAVHQPQPPPPVMMPPPPAPPPVFRPSPPPPTAVAFQPQQPWATPPRRRMNMFLKLFLWCIAIGFGLFVLLVIYFIINPEHQ